MIGQFASRSNSKALEILQGLALNKDSDSWEVLADLGEIEWLTHHVLPTMPLDAKWRVAGWVDDNPKLEADLMRKLQVAINECDEIRHKTQNNANNREPPSFDKVMGAIQSGARFVPGATQIRDSLSKDQISQVASLWLDEQDFRKANNYLRMIARQIFPLPIQEIIDRVNQGNQPWRFEEIVSECSHNLVREFGLALIAKPEPDYRGFLCLLKSYRPNDLPKMVECLDRFLNLDSDDIHRLCIDLRNLVKEMSPQQRIPFMIWTYEHSPCSACRGWGAEILIKDGTLPESYRQEMLVDADSYARELASKMPI